MILKSTALRSAMLATTAIAGVSSVAMPAPAQAQALQPVVDVCTGISLDPSAVTDIVDAVNDPLVGSLSTLTDNLLQIDGVLSGIPLVGAIFGPGDTLDVDDVDVELDDILNNIANGENIGLTVLDTDGNLLAPGDCNLAADGLSLNDPAGIAIGGNQITGLGDGEAASAGEFDAIAFGNGASTAVGADGAIAFGTDASATATNSVALGAGSIADRGPTTGYTAPGLTGTFDSAGSVSVGAPGAERQITNLAPGTAATDAATVGQVQGALDAIDAMADGAVQYDDATQNSVTLAGAGGTTLTNVADGELSAGSSDAVNGSQLFDTNAAVADNTADIADNTADIAALDDSAVQYDDATQDTVTFEGAGGTTLANVADGELSAGSNEAVNGSQLFDTNEAVADNAADIADNTADIADNTTDIAENTADIADNTADIADNTADIAALDEGTVQYDDATQGTVTFEGADGTTLTNVAEGDLSAGSSDAVNGSQLFDTNQAVAGNTADIADNTADIADNTADIAALDESAVQYDDASQGTITFEGADGTTLTNVADGEVSAGSSDAVNGSQLFETNQQVAQNTTDIGELDGRVTQNEDDIADLDTRLGEQQVVIDGFDDRITDNEEDIVDLDGRVTVNEGDIAQNSADIVDLDGRVTVNEGDIADLDGRVTVNEGDIAQNTTDIANLDGRVTINEGDIAQNTSDILDLDGRVTVNEGDIAVLDDRVTVNEGDIANLDGRVTVNEGDIANLDGRVTVNEGDIANLDGRVTVNEGDIAQNSTDIANVDDRVTVNEGDITDLDVRVTDNSDSIIVLQEQVANVPVGYVTDPDAEVSALSDEPTDTVALISASGGPATLTNVAAGTLAEDSTEAVNGSQLYATNVQVGQNTEDIEIITNNLEGSTVVAVQYSDPDNPTRSNGGTITNDVTLVGADPDAPVALHNVADGVLANDAVNLGQMQAGLDAVLTDSMTYTDMRFVELAFDLEDVREDAFSGTAAAMAVAGIPQTIEAGRSMFGGAVGHYRGETAFAIGGSSTFNDGRGVVKAGATMDTHGKGGVSAGVGFSF